ncbi:MAG: hypothetical protein KGM87_01290, partial [Betaproteobacteria bacterium]|nr:hypothetical protein [Betaproteobacteria bacterium]
ASMPAAPAGPASPRAAGGSAQARASAALAQEGRYAGATCGGGPLFSRFGAAHECPSPDEGVRL